MIWLWGIYYGTKIVITYKKIIIKNNNKAIAMMRRKSPRSENIYLIENHCQANISKWRRGKEFNTFSWMRKNCTLYTCHYDITKICYIISVASNTKIISRRNTSKYKIVNWKIAQIKKVHPVNDI